MGGLFFICSMTAMDRIQAWSQHRWFIPAFALLLFVVNVLQSATTGLLHDEAYYWYVSNQPDGGYMFGPPGIAVIISLGYSLLHNDVGIRLGSCLFTSLSVIGFHRLISPKNNLLFVSVILSVTPYMIAGFVAALDPPLIFFTILFLLTYRWFLREESWKSTLCLSVCMALMIYVKYHGVLAIVFVLASNPSLFKNPRWFMASLSGAVIYLPHTLWLIEHDFQPIVFHLIDRSPESFSIGKVLNYLLSQMLMAGIPAGLLLLFAAYKATANHPFDRALKFIFYGTYGFFLFHSFRGQTEANWTAICLVPLVAFSYQYLEQEIKLQKWVYTLLPFSVLCVAIPRIFIATDFFVDQLKIKTELHHWEEWAAQVKEKAHGRPVVFMNSYQKASKYMYYTGEKAISLNNVMNHVNDFHFNHTELELEGQPVYFYSHYGIVPKYTTSSSEEHTLMDDYTGCMVDSFMSWMKVNIQPEEKEYTVDAGTASFDVKYTISIPEVYEHRDTRKAFISYQIIDDKRLPYFDSVTQLTLHDALAQQQNTIRIKTPKDKGHYTLFVSTYNDGYPPHINSPRMQLVVE